MRARISVLTIGVDDLERAARSYRDGLGLSTDGIIGQEFEHGADSDGQLWEVVYNPDFIPA